jgi:hypothetical protein
LETFASSHTNRDGKKTFCFFPANPQANSASIARQTNEWNFINELCALRKNNFCSEKLHLTVVVNVYFCVWRLICFAGNLFNRNIVIVVVAGPAPAVYVLWKTYLKSV